VEDSKTAALYKSVDLYREGRPARFAIASARRASPTSDDEEELVGESLPAGRQALEGTYIIFSRSLKSSILLTLMLK